MAKFLIKPVQCDQKMKFSNFEMSSLEMERFEKSPQNSPSAFRISSSPHQTYLSPQKATNKTEKQKTQLSFQHSFKIDDILKSNKILSDEEKLKNSTKSLNCIDDNQFSEKCYSSSTSSYCSPSSSFSPPQQIFTPPNDLVTNTNFQIQLMNLANTCQLPFYPSSDNSFPFAQYSSMNPFAMDLFKSVQTDMHPISRLTNEVKEINSNTNMSDQFAKKSDPINNIASSNTPAPSERSQDGFKKTATKNKKVKSNKKNKKKEKRMDDGCSSGCGDLACCKSF